MIYVYCSEIDLVWGGKEIVLRARDKDAEEKLRKVPENQILQVSTKKISDRSYKQLALAQKMIDVTFENQQQFATRELLRDALSIAVGHCEIRQKLNGDSYLVAASWSFKETEHEKFNALTDRILLKIDEHFGFNPLEK